MNNLSLTLISVFYLLFLFYLAFVAEKYKSRNRSLINNPLVFSLSLAIYCSAWTFYGSVGRIGQSGLEFLTIYLGPTLAMLLCWSVLRKIYRIAQVHGITSIADFVSSRYGKNRTLGVVITVFSLMAGIPYIGLQLKAISSSFGTLTGVHHKPFFLEDAAFYMVVILVAFTILYGTRKILPNERHEGMVFAVAAESIFKLLAFLVAGISVTYIWHNGWEDVFQRYYSSEIQQSFDFERVTGYGNWFIYTLISGCAFFLLPRQFQVAIVENQSEDNLRQAIWLFPLYLFLIILFAIPIALSGVGLLGFETNNDNIVLSLPIYFSSPMIALFVYLGGFSAATGMIIVECIAISTMITNSIVLPGLLENRKFKKRFRFRILDLAVWIRRLSIIFILALAYIYFKVLPEELSLVSIGLISFVAISQLAPAVLGGNYFKTLNRKGVLSGIIVGFLIWFFGLVIPSVLPVLPVLEIPFIRFYEAFKVFNIESFDHISNVAFWSLLLNTGTTAVVSLNTSPSVAESKQAILFVDIFKYSNPEGRSVFWKGTARNENLFSLLAGFLGRTRSKEALEEFASKYNIDLKVSAANPAMVSFVENTISQYVGTSTASMLVSSVSKEEIVTIDEVLEVLRRTEQVVEHNEELKDKTTQLEKLSAELRLANRKLKDMDTQKDDFIRTVAHEFRTPLTAIKALTEIINDHQDLEEEEKTRFLETIIEETDRLGRLVNEILDIERYESGKHILRLTPVELTSLGNTIMLRMGNLAREKGDIFEFRTPGGEIHADEDKLIRMLINLVSNSIKFTPVGGKVSLFMEKKQEYTIFEVRDNGIGIHESQLYKVFDKFYQAENLKSGDTKGSGLGLAIARNIAELHQGMIDIKSTEGEGTCVTVIFPNSIQ